MFEILVPIIFVLFIATILIVLLTIRYLIDKKITRCKQRLQDLYRIEHNIKHLKDPASAEEAELIISELELNLKMIEDSLEENEKIFKIF